MSMSIAQTRRRFLTTLSLAGAAGFVGAPWTLAAEGVLETTTVRLTKVPGICLAPQYVAEELLRAEGFTEIRYVDAPAGVLPLGKADFTLAYASNFLRQIDAGDPITLLSGVMVGCFELFGNESIHGIPDLKGKTVGVQGMGSLGNTLVLMMAAQVGLDPDKDIHWVADPAVKADRAVHPRQDRCVFWRSPRAPGFTRPAYRAGDPKQRHRSPVVAVFLLPVGG